MQHLAPFADTDPRLAAMAAHPSALASPMTSGVAATRRAHPAPRAVPTAAIDPDRPVSGRAAQVPAVAPRPEDAPGTHPLSTVPIDPEGSRNSTVPTDPEEGSLVTEYGLLAVVAATVAGVVIQWASGGALVTLFNALLRHARSLVGA